MRVFSLFVSPFLICMVGVLLFPWNVSAQSELWVVQYDGPVHGFDELRALRVDDDGNVIVTGHSAGDGTEDDYMTIKYDTDGNLVWGARYDGPSSGVDTASDMAIDGSGNIIVTGKSFGGDLDLNDYLTVKYDTDGNLLWQDRYQGPGSSSEYARALGVDAAGNIYVTGIGAGGNGAPENATIKYDQNGNRLWLAAYDGSWPVDQAVDDAGNVYVTGRFWSGAEGKHYDFYTVKYDTYGTQLWTARYNGPGDKEDGVSAIAVDNSGNVYVTGHCGTDTGYDYATVKYDTTGNALWTRTYDGPSQKNDMAYALALGPYGDIYVTGYCQGESMEPDYQVTIKYDTEGNQVWAAQYESGGGVYDSTSRRETIHADQNGYVYVVARGEYDDILTIKYNSAGEPVWVSNSSGVGMSLATDESGNLFVGGVAEGTDYVTIKYHPCSDQDGDTYEDEACGGDDCDDDNSDDPLECYFCDCASSACATCARCIHPGAREYPAYGIDSNCDGSIDMTNIQAVIQLLLL